MAIKRKTVISLTVICVGMAVIAVLTVLKPKPNPEDGAKVAPLIQVSAIEAKSAVHQLSVVTQGTAQSLREIELVAQVSGQITKVEPAFVDGGFFEAGQVLLQIDPRDYQTAILNAKANVAEAELRLAEERGRNSQVKKQWRDLGSEVANDLFLRKPQLNAAVANLEAARGELARAQLNLTRTEIRVPFSGHVRNKNVDIGAFVSVGTRLATVFDSQSIEIRLPLTEHQSSLIDLPLFSRVEGAAPAFDVSIHGEFSGKAHQWLGSITRAEAFIDERSRMYYVFAEVDLKRVGSVPLLPGSFVEATIRGKNQAGVLRLPRSALYSQSQIVYLDSENKTVFENVNVLQKNNEFILVEASIKDGTLISLEKQSLTPEGTEVVPTSISEMESKDGLLELSASSSSIQAAKE